MLKGKNKTGWQIHAINNMKNFMNHKKNLSNCLTSVFELCLKLNTKQNVEKFSKY